MILDCSNVVNFGPFDDYKSVSVIMRVFVSSVQVLWKKRL